MTIIVERADNARRGLSRGYKWQEYRIATVRFIPKDVFSSIFGSSMKTCSEAMDKWELSVASYINRRSDKLGLHIHAISAQLVEEPNESKVVESALWHIKKPVCVWSVWANLEGPVLEFKWSERFIPLFNFWPRDLVNPISAMPEIVDATKLSQYEQGHIISREAMR
tara:strand:- start:714 stop:1214 length:501 start_codon:yes stop_codon:yes gene_type:complete